MSSPANVSGIIRDGIRYVPLRSVVEQLGGSIEWNNQTKAATFTVRNVTGQIYADSQSFTANGQTHSLTGTTFVENGTLHVPVDALTDIGLTTS
ncbi:MAG: copper amine oxidase N-terminal domain-containing protein [Fimbriimonadaceae bacterium]